MATGNRSIHLVTPQVSPKPQSLDPADIAASVLETVRECTKALRDFEEYQQWAVGQMSGQLYDLELAALRAMARRKS